MCVSKSCTNIDTHVTRASVQDFATCFPGKKQKNKTIFEICPTPKNIRESTFVVTQGEVEVAGDGCSQGEKEAVATQRFVFIHCADGLDHLREEATTWKSVSMLLQGFSFRNHWKCGGLNHCCQAIAYVHHLWEIYSQEMGTLIFLKRPRRAASKWEEINLILTDVRDSPHNVWPLLSAINRIKYIKCLFGRRLEAFGN